MSIRTYLAACCKIFGNRLLLGFPFFFQTFLKLVAGLKTRETRKKKLTRDLQTEGIWILGSLGFLTTAVSKGPKWALVQQSSAGQKVLAEGKSKQWLLTYSGFSANVQRQTAVNPTTDRLTQSCAHPYCWSSLAALCCLCSNRALILRSQLERVAVSWVKREVSCLGDAEQWFTKGTNSVSFWDIHHTVSFGFLWL